MNRTIENIFKGRKKIVDEGIHRSPKEMLLNLEGATRINIEVDKGGHCERFKNATLKEVVELLKNEFPPFSNSRFEPCRYLTQNHQVFSGKQSEKHYIDLQEGYMVISRTREEIGVRGDPYIKASFSYVLQRKE